MRPPAEVNGIFDRLVRCGACGDELDFRLDLCKPAYVCSKAKGNPLGPGSHVVIAAEAVEPYLLGLIRRYILDFSDDEIAEHLVETCSLAVDRSRELDRDTAEALAGYIKSVLSDCDDWFEMRAALTLWVKSAVIEHTEREDNHGCNVRISLNLHSASERSGE